MGGAGLDTLTWLLYEKELGKANYALHWTCVCRPSNILLACEGEQRERYLLPAVRGERHDCQAMTEPGAGSDLRGMKSFAREDGAEVRHRLVAENVGLQQLSEDMGRHARFLTRGGKAHLS